MASNRYTRIAVRVKELLSKYGSTLTIRDRWASADPVTGLGGADGADRDVIGVITAVKDGFFADSNRKSGDRMLVLAPDSAVVAGEIWVNGAEQWPLIEVNKVAPDNQTVISYNALVRG